MKVVIYVTFLLKLLLRPLAAAASSCPAKQYSGKFQAKDDYVNNKAIIGHSYKNLTIKYPQECFSYCVSDCKCLSYQIFSGTRCELLDEDQDTTTIQQEMFGYKHYRLRQHFKVCFYVEFSLGVREKVGKSCSGREKSWGRYSAYTDGDVLLDTICFFFQDFVLEIG